MTQKILVSLGGNAILKHTDKGTAEEQFKHVRETSNIIVELLRAGHHIALTHGNGPQVGDILLSYHLSRETLPPMPLDVCVAQSQGMIGYMLQISLQNALKEAKIIKSAVTIITQTVVHKDDPQLKKPSKPIGPFYTAMEASKLRKEEGWTVVDDSGRGYRRVVPSPLPIGLVEESSIKSLFEDGVLLIASGGGGIPVTEDDNGDLHGLEAVVDKDYTASLLASIIGADILLVLTDVDNVAINYGKHNQRDLNHITLGMAREYLKKGYFPSGTMGPKIESSIHFLENGGKKAIITSLKNVSDALKGNSGTLITQNEIKL